ncbi:MAG: hypothetical protein Q4B36_05680 [Tissierellia bacterium]|nr:hypothetical protein [Tissierellia bacterium]
MTEDYERIDDDLVDDDDLEEATDEEIEEIMEEIWEEVDKEIEEMINNPSEEIKEHLSRYGTWKNEEEKKKYLQEGLDLTGYGDKIILG